MLADTPSREQAAHNNDEGRQFSFVEHGHLYLPLSLVPQTLCQCPRAVVSSNIQISIEIPPEIALAMDFSISLTLYSRHTYNMPRTPDNSPVRAQRIPPPGFGPVPPPSQPSCPAVGILGQHHASVKSESEDWTESDDVFLTHASDDNHVPALTQSALHGSGNAAFNIIDNQCELDVNLPWPVYPCAPGEHQLHDSLPNTPHHPRKYYVIFKGLRIGVFYKK